MHSQGTQAILYYLMYKSSFVGPHGSSKVIQLLLETHCAGSYDKDDQSTVYQGDIF